MFHAIALEVGLNGDLSCDRSSEEHQQAAWGQQSRTVEHACCGPRLDLPRSLHKGAMALGS